MRILLLNYEYPPLGGGAGAISQQISEQLARRGHQITIISSAFKGLPNQQDFGLLKIFRVDAHRKFLYKSSPVQMLRWAKQAYQFFKQNFSPQDFDLVFANFSIPGGLVAKKILKETGLPFVLISHGHDIPWFCKKEMWLYHFFLYYRIKKICKKSSLNFVQTTEMKQNIDRFLGTKMWNKNIIIPNGCSAPITDFTEKHSTFTVVFSARFVKQKDPLTLLKALKLLKEKDVCFKANFFGDGPLMHQMKHFVIKNKMQNMVSFFGWTNRNELYHEYRKSHVFVLTSLHEAMSVSVMDALASGLYAVVTDTGQNKNLIENNQNGIIVEKGNAFMLSDSLVKAYEKYSNGALDGSLNNTALLKEYNWDVIALKYESVLLDIVNRKAF